MGPKIKALAQQHFADGHRHPRELGSSQSFPPPQYQIPPPPRDQEPIGDFLSGDINFADRQGSNEWDEWDEQCFI
jgi:hypothetical protein